jgi:hypothetical protein
MNRCQVFRIAALASSLAVSTILAADNALTVTEKEQGWRLLFDGQTTTGWRGFQKEAFPTNGWTVTDGCLKCLGRKGGDIVTSEKFNDFELTWEWKLSPKGNSGVKYFVDEKRRDAVDAKRPDAVGKVSTFAVAHEYQMIDDNHYPEKLADNQKTGAWYGVTPPKDAKPKPVGEFNQSRLVVRGNHVEHWLNGTLVLAYDTDSAASRAGIAASKFKNVPGYADKIATPILLQDHSTIVWFRNIKLRPLPNQ